MHVTNCLWGYIAWITISMLIMISGHYMYVKLFLLSVLFEGICIHICMWVFIFIGIVSEVIHVCIHKAEHHFSCDMCVRSLSHTSVAQSSIVWNMWSDIKSVRNHLWASNPLSCVNTHILEGVIIVCVCVCVCVRARTCTQGITHTAGLYSWTFLLT